MSCECESLTEGISIGCSNNIGGMKKFYIARKCDIDTLALNSPDEEIGTITMQPGKTFLEFEFRKGACSYTQNTESNTETGTELCTQTITLKLHRREKTKRDKLLLIGKLVDLVIIGTDNNDINWLFGENNGVNLKTKDGGSGAAKTDSNEYVLTFVGEEPEEANTVTDAAVAAVI